MKENEPTGGEVVSPLVTTKEAGDFLRMSRVTLWRAVRNKTVPAPICVNGRNFWLMDELRAHIDKLSQQRSAA